MKISAFWRRARRADPSAPAPAHRASADARALIEHYVGCRFVATPDAAGRLVLGYGETEAVEEGDTILLSEADERLRVHLTRHVEPAVRSALVRPARQHEYDAMVSLAHEVGAAAFSASELVQWFNHGDAAAVVEAFTHWPAAAAADAGLRWRQRRAAEAALFRGLVFVDAIRIGDATP